MPTLIAASIGVAVGIFGFAAAFGLTGSWWAALAIAALVVGGVVTLVRRHPIIALDESACSRGLKIVSGVATVVALLQLARLVVFIVAPSHTGCSATPWSDFELRHSCLSAYYVAANAASNVPNVYDDALYSEPGKNAAGRRNARMLGLFKIDVYEYPPPFLLLPRALGLITQDFARYRMLWFALNAGAMLFAMLVVVRFLGPTAGTRALLLSPLVWAAFPTMSVLQKGNAQGIVVALTILAMVLFEQRRRAAGSALLAYVALSKLFPGLLAVYLLARREWQALAWTAASSVVFLLATFMVFGSAPFTAFFVHLPGLLGGESFPALRNPVAMAINFSVPGLVFKLKLFGVPGMSFGAAKIVGWLYTIVAIVATVHGARRTLATEQKPLIWLAVLILASLRSPFLPQAYAALPPLWLLTLLAASCVPTPKTLALVLLAWVGLDVYWPQDWPLDPRLLAVITVVPQTLTVAVALLALRRAGTDVAPVVPSTPSTASG